MAELKIYWVGRLHIILKENGSFKETDQVSKLLKVQKPSKQPPLLTKE
jgi:hypothetical protein